MIADTMVTALINTLIRELHNDSVPGRKQEAETVRIYLFYPKHIIVSILIHLAHPSTVMTMTVNSRQCVASSNSFMHSFI